VIIIKNLEEINKIRKSCQIVAKVIEELKFYIKEGLSTKDIELFIENLIEKMGGVPAFKGYKGYPASACISVNSQVVHGIPSDKFFIKEGDIVSVDVGVICDGFYGDGAYTYPVGKISEEAKKINESNKRSIIRGNKKS